MHKDVEFYKYKIYFLLDKVIWISKAYIFLWNIILSFLLMVQFIIVSSEFEH